MLGLAASRVGGMTIPLAPTLLAGSSNLPGGFGRAVLEHLPIWSCSMRGFACHFCCQKRGALLPHLFTLTHLRLRPSGSGYGGQARLDSSRVERPARRSPEPEGRRAKVGGIFSVPLSVGSPRPGITRRTALWSSDFPLPTALRSHAQTVTAGSDHPVNCG
jgi:hypothetical protein